LSWSKSMCILKQTPRELVDPHDHCLFHRWTSLNGRGQLAPLSHKPLDSHMVG
jgi:hypothetical protein